jgi:hypothetical protein
MSAPTKTTSSTTPYAEREIRECPGCGSTFRPYAKAKKSLVCPACREAARTGAGFRGWSY